MSKIWITNIEEAGMHGKYNGMFHSQIGEQ